MRAASLHLLACISAADYFGNNLGLSVGAVLPNRDCMLSAYDCVDIGRGRAAVKSNTNEFRSSAFHLTTNAISPRGASWSGAVAQEYLLTFAYCFPP